ncbi:MAG: HAMP domain-containing sensor histidine kinase [bacterium]|nr:HAMP domain-containing sensor histidine kinase [bacterium]
MMPVGSLALVALSFLAVALVGCALWIVWLHRRVVALARERDEKRVALNRTSKLLIDKNMELFDQNVRQQRQLESKEDFIGIVSHQLRTPATEVKWGLAALESELKEHGPESEYFEKLKRSAERMVHLIDGLVRLMALEERYRQLAIEPYDPDAVVRRAVEDMSAKFSDKHIHLTLALSADRPIESMDADSLELVVENLIENAYDYTPEGGTVTVTTLHGEDGGFMCSVADTGVGISREKLATIFIKFQRSETATRMNSGGMGLGLYLVKNIVERHGGTVGFKSAEGNGSTFHFALPATRRIS